MVLQASATRLLIYTGREKPEKKASSRNVTCVDTLLISKAILHEVLATLAVKFSVDAEALSRTAVVLAEMAELVKPQHRVQVFKDDPDNRVLECAEE